MLRALAKLLGFGTREGLPYEEFDGDSTPTESTYSRAKYQKTVRLLGQVDCDEAVIARAKCGDVSCIPMILHRANRYQKPEKPQKWLGLLWQLLHLHSQAVPIELLRLVVVMPDTYEYLRVHFESCSGTKKVKYIGCKKLRAMAEEEIRRRESTD